MSHPVSAFAIIGILATVTIVLCCLLAKQIRFWKKIAHLAGVRHLHELPDGNYQLGGLLGTVGPGLVCSVFQINEDPDLGPKNDEGCLIRRMLYVRQGDCLPPMSMFHVKNGQLCDGWSLK